MRRACRSDSRHGGALFAYQRETASAPVEAGKERPLTGRGSEVRRRTPAVFEPFKAVPYRHTGCCLSQRRPNAADTASPLAAIRACGPSWIGARDGTTGESRRTAFGHPLDAPMAQKKPAATGFSEEWRRGDSNP